MEGKSQEYKQAAGIRQGCPLSPYLFTMFMTVLFHDIHEEVDRKNVGQECVAFPVHELLIVKNGIYILENLDLEGLANDKVYEFAFIFSPLRLKGATGSPGNPIAVR